MALENVINEIISQAEKQKQEIVDLGKQEAKKILEEAMHKAKEQSRLFGEETKKILDETKRREISALNIQLHKMFLETKKNILDELHMQLVEKIDKLDSNKRRELLQKLVEKARKELPDAKFIYCNERDKEVSSGIKNLKFASSVDCLGGVLVENEDRSVKINYTFDLLLQNVKEAYLNEVAKRIF